MPHAFTPLPCLLLPSADLVLLPPLGGVFLPLPPAVRPVTLFVQFVLLEPAGFGTTNGFAAVAH